MFAIPTDSIPKFLAVFGLALVVASVGFVYTELERCRDIQSQLIRMDSEVKFREMQFKEVVDRYESMKKQIIIQEKSGQPFVSTDLNRFREMAHDLKANGEALCATVGDVMPKVQGLKVLQKYSPYYFFADGLLFFLGAVLAAYGFWRWHKDH